MGIDMLNKILIVTEDSRTILPSINRWKPKLGTGINLQDHKEINALLTVNGLQIPRNNLNNEVDYREILKEYIRPAKFMYAGVLVTSQIFCNLPEPRLLA